MHPRNRYSTEPADFVKLAEFRPSLKPFLIEKRINFNDPAAVRELTCALLEKDFGLKVEIPVDKLIPTVPQKLNYIHWVEDLLSCWNGDATCKVIPKGRNVVGIDIGTGTSCIYPLLGTCLNGWSFIATDVSVDTVQCARENVSRNNSEGLIKVKHVSDEVVLKEALDSSIEAYSFTMCNPPFFENEEDRLGSLTSRSSQRPLPSTFSTGIMKETVTAGGEVGFIKRIIRDSLELKNKVRWYTSLVGKKADLKELVLELKSHQVPVITTTEFVQGKTWRWGIAWSFDCAMKDKAEEMTTYARKRKQSYTLHLLVQGAEESLPSPSLKGIKEVQQWLEKQLQELSIAFESQGDGDDVVVKCKAEKITWLHQRKKRRLLKKLDLCGSQDGESDKELTTEQYKKQIEREIEALCSPCNLDFACYIKLQVRTSITTKKKKSEAVYDRKSERREEAVCIELAVGDANKDLIHQLLQYLQNQMNLTVFNL